jgi:hypothetical protein
MFLIGVSIVNFWKSSSGYADNHPVEREDTAAAAKKLDSRTLTVPASVIRLLRL